MSKEWPEDPTPEALWGGEVSVDTDSLDAAWADVYIALPVAWLFRGIWCRQYRRALKWSAVAEPSPRGPAVVGIADSPIEALVALTVKLRDLPRS